MLSAKSDGLTAVPITNQQLRPLRWPGATGTTTEAQAVLAKYGSINSGNLQQVMTDLSAAAEFAKMLSNLQVGPAAALSEAEQAIKAVNEQIDPLVAQAQALGLATDKLETVRSDAIQAVRDAEEQARVQAELSDAYKGVGASISELVDQAQQMAQVAQQTANMWGSAFDTLTAANRALLISDQSLSPLARYQNSSAELGRLNDAVLGGDAASASDLAASASQFLQSSFAYNGSTETYGRDFAHVRSLLGDTASFSGSQQSRMNDAVQVAVAG